MARRGRQAEADAGHRGDHDVLRILHSVDDRTAIGRVLDNARPGADHVEVRRLGEQLGDAPREVARERRRRTRGRAGLEGLEPLVRAAAVGKITA